LKQFKQEYSERKYQLGGTQSHCLASKDLMPVGFPFRELPPHCRLGGVASISVNVQQSGRSIERPLHLIIPG